MTIISNLPPLDSLSKDLIFPAVDKSKSPELTVQVSLDQLVALSAGPRGPAGTPGVTGPIGPSGPAGLDSTVSGFSGFSGTSGINGASGTSGFSGMTGASGISGRNGINGLSGSSGSSGVSGYSGSSGASGASGKVGTPGTSGFSGARGTSGESGLSGSSGASGKSGRDGISGISGQSGYSGESGLSGESGVSGFSGKAGSNGLPGISGYSGHAGYSGYSGVSGQRGTDGSPGAVGISGTSGASGASGNSGISGISGFSGTNGLSGLSGFSGWSGAPGSAVDKGDSGVSGDSGASGFSGFSGFSGRDGRSFNSGYSGTSGISGRSGFSGVSGYSGLSGVSGHSGIDGSSGISGISGFSGYSGYNGIDGASGFSGQSGYSGESGAAGESGVSGFSGTSGTSGHSGVAGYGYVSVQQFGAVGDAVTDDRDAIQNAISSLSPFGGTVVIPNSFRCYIGASNINIPENVTLKGPHDFVGIPEDVNNIKNLGGSLIINANCTITLNSNSGITGILIVQEQVTVPMDYSNFIGVAVRINNESKDSFILNSVIVGSDTAIQAINAIRPNINHVYYDAKNGIELAGGIDFQVHNCSAFSEVTNLNKFGFGLKALNASGKSTVFNCLTRNHFTGFDLSDSENISVINCSAYGITTGTGFLLTGNSENVKFVSCLSEGNYDGFVIDTTDQNKSTILDFHGKANENSGVKLVNGSAYVTNGIIDTVANGIIVETTSTTLIDFTRFANVSSATIKIASTTTNLAIGEHNTYDSSNVILGPQNSNLPEVIATEQILQLPLTGQVFNINSTATISTITGGWAGRSVTLLFNQPATINSSVGENLVRLSNETAFTTNTGSSVTLVCNGIQWFEISRSV